MSDDAQKDTTRHWTSSRGDYELVPKEPPSPERVEAAAKILAKWIGYAWDGLGERDISAEYPDWTMNGIGTLTMQGGRPALRRIAAEMLNV